MSIVVPETPVNPEEVAREIILGLRQLMRRMDGYGFLPPDRRRKLTVVTATVPDEFFFVVGDACDGIPRLAAASEFTSDQARHVLAFERAFRSVAREGELMVRGVLDTIADVKSGGSRGALRVYETAKRMNASDENELLVPYIDAMRLALGRSRPRLTEEEKEELAAARQIVRAAKAARALEASKVEAPKALEAPKVWEEPKVQS